MADRPLKPGVVRQLPQSEIAELGRNHRQVRSARWVTGFEYADASAANQCKLMNQLRHGHTVIGPLYPAWGGVCCIVIMDAAVERRERGLRANG